MKQLALSVTERDGSKAPITVSISEVLLAGYTGRDRAAVLEHIRELEELGVAPPPRVPMVYTIAPELTTLDDSLTVEHGETSGETEIYLVPTADGLLVGTGSDHTDRKHEAIDVAESKSMSSKVLSRDVWRYDDVRDHWDTLEIRSWVTDAQGRRLYQEGRLDSFLTVEAVHEELKKLGHETEGRLIFGGTLPAIGGLAYGRRFEGELHDPVLGRSLAYGYDVVVKGA